MRKYRQSNDCLSLCLPVRLCVAARFRSQNVFSVPPPPPSSGANTQRNMCRRPVWQVALTQFVVIGQRAVKTPPISHLSAQPLARVGGLSSTGLDAHVASLLVLGSLPNMLEHEIVECGLLGLAVMHVVVSQWHFVVLFGGSGPDLNSTFLPSDKLKQKSSRLRMVNYLCFLNLRLQN